MVQSQSLLSSLLVAAIVCVPIAGAQDEKPSPKTAQPTVAAVPSTPAGKSTRPPLPAPTLAKPEASKPDSRKQEAAESETSRPEPSRPAVPKAPHKLAAPQSEPAKLPSDVSKSQPLVPPSEEGPTRASRPAKAPLTMPKPSISSKQRPPAPGPLAPRAVTKLPNRLVFSFEDADWDDVFRWLAQISGKALRVERKPGGNFNYFDTREYTVPEAIDIINSVLLSKGFVLLMRQNFLMVVKVSEDGFPVHLVETVTIKDLPQRGRTEPVKVLIALDRLVAEQAKKEFEPIKGPYGRLYPLASSNQILVVDTARNVQAIVDIVGGTDVDTGAMLKVFPLKHISVLDAEHITREMLGLAAWGKQSPGNTADTDQDDTRGRIFGRMFGRMGRRMGGGPSGDGPTGGGPMGDGPMGDGPMGDGPMGDGPMGGGPMGGGPMGSGPMGDDSRRTVSSSPGRSPSQSATTWKTYVSADERTNTLFVTAMPDKLALVSELIRTLDVPEAAKKQEERQLPSFCVYPVEAGTAEGMVKALGELLERSPETRVTAHPSNHALLVFATPREHQRIGAMLEQFKAEGLRIEVIRLRSLDASNVALLIKSLLGQKNDEQRSPFAVFMRSESSPPAKDKGGPAIEADASQNQLVVRGTGEQIATVRQILEKMGEKGLEGDSLALGPEYRIIPLGQADPMQILDQVRTAWSTMGNDRSPVKVHVLGNTGSRPLQTASAWSQPTGGRPSNSGYRFLGSASMRSPRQSSAGRGQGPSWREGNEDGGPNDGRSFGGRRGGFGGMRGQRGAGPGGRD